MKIKFLDFIKKIDVLLYLYLFLLIISVLLMLIYTKEELYFAVNRLHAPFADVFFASITHLGSSTGCILITLIVLAVNFRKGFLLSTSYILTFIISQILKNLVKAPRPHLFFAKKLSGIYLIKGVSMLDTNSFPSGHAVSAFSAALVLTYVARKKWWGVPLLFVAVLVAYSRLYLSEHFLQDVVAGSALGTLFTSCWLFFIDRKKFLHNKFWNQGIFGKNK